MAENVIDTLKLDIIVNTKQNGQSITTLRNSLEKLYKFLNGVKDQDFSKVSNDIAKIGDSLTPLINAVNSLNGQGTKNLNSLSNALKKIKEFTAGMSTQDISSLDKNLVQVSNSLAKFVSSLNSLDETGLKNIKTISSLSTLSSGLNRLDKTIDGLDVEKLKKKFTQMAEAIDPFITKVSSAKESLVALNNVMGGAKTLTKTATPKATTTTTPKVTTNTNILGGKLGKSLNFGSMIAKLYFVRNITKQLGQDLAKVVQYGIDYEETLNLWQTAMRGNISQARVFTSEMTKAYGISSATLMNYQATFKNMLGALGNISETTAYGLSEALTQMALDFSSLYNVSVESAMTKFQAVLSGQVRPIRTAGYDITEQTLFQLYQQIGGTKTVRQLNQTEKQLLRILAVYKQMERSGATGDLSKTMWISTANQIRMAKEQLKEFATWIGVGLNSMLEQSKILITINAYLYAGVALAKEFAVYMGYVEKDYSIDADFEDIENANKEVDELKGKLLGFDKFQVLASAGTDNADVEQVLLDNIKAYQGLLDNAENPAFQKSLDILKAIGLELDENGNIVGGFDTLVEKAKEFSKTVGGIAFIVGLLTNPWLAVLGAIEYCYWTNEDFKKSVNESFGRIKENATSIMPLFTNIFEKALPIVEKIAIWVLDILELVSPFIIEILPYLLKIIDHLSPIIQTVMIYTSNILNYVTPMIPILTTVLDLLIPILDIINGLLNLNYVIPSYLGLALTKPLQIALVICEAVLKAITTIMELLSTLFTWDWSTLGKRLSSLWSNWNFAGKDIYANSNFLQPNFRANGGLATKGSLFYAGEAGPELVTHTSGGGSTIMNMKQLEDAVARGMIRGAAATQGSSGQQISVNVSGRSLFSIFVDEARSNGYELVKVR